MKTTLSKKEFIELCMKIGADVQKKLTRREIIAVKICSYSSFIELLEKLPEPKTMIGSKQVVKIYMEFLTSSLVKVMLDDYNEHKEANQ